jgi:hypothetical protein
MSVTLRKDVHRWIIPEGSNFTACRFCGTILDKGQSPALELCTAMHDPRCVCDLCNPSSYEDGQMVDIRTDRGRELCETFGFMLPQAEVVKTLDNGRIRIQPGTVAYPVRSYTLDVTPDAIRPSTR